MIKRGDWASRTSYTDQDISFLDPASERSAGLMLTAFPSRWGNPGPAPSNRQFTTGDEAAFTLASPSVPSGDTFAVAATDFPAVFDLTTLDGTNGFRLEGIGEGGRSGRSVSSAGDVNGDGVDDLIIGAYHADDNRSVSYVVFGSTDGIPASLDLADLDGTNGFRLRGFIPAGDLRYRGLSVSEAGDVNGDGFDDIIVGNTQAKVGGRGASYIVFGKADGFEPTVFLTRLNGSDGTLITGDDPNDFSGYSVSGAGDVNGDGFDDVIIAAPSSLVGSGAESYVVFGSADDLPAEFRSSNLDGTNGFVLDGYMSSVSVSDAGDVNGDGFDDLIIGAPKLNPDGHTRAGISYVVFGNESFTRTFHLYSLNGDNGFRVDGVSAEDESGSSVSSAGDVNGDGFDDLIVGAVGAGPGGESYVIFGGDGFSPSLDLANLDGTNGFRIVGGDDYTGVSVSSAGDVNGDGFDDVIIGSAGLLSDTFPGAAYVVFGHAGAFAASFDLSMLDGTKGFRLDGIDPGDQSGISVSSAGDVNGDGFDDIIVGAPGADADGDLDSGETYIVYGRAPTEAVTRTGSAASQTIRGGDFNDTLNGEGGNDRLGGGLGADTLNGGIGNDWAYYDTADARVRASLNQPANNSGEAAGETYISIENLFGSAFNDKLTGDALANRLRGEGGADTLSGANGNDVLAGGAGHDSLTGGKGADSFTFGGLLSADSDTIVDFTGGVDRIALDDDIFGFAEGALPPGSFVIGGTAQDADDRLIYNSADGQLFFDADGTGAQAQVLIATLTGAPVIAVGDFVVI